MISIVTPSFGQLEWLRLAVASVADQEGIQVEHIIQDAGTSGIETMSEQFASDSNHHLKLVVEPDAGMYDAINRGLRRAKGEISAYLNCDEQYLPDALSKVINFFDAHAEVDVLFADVILIDQEGQPISYRRTVLPKPRHTRFAHLNTLSCATFFRRKLLDRGFYFDPAWKVVGDAVWVEKLLKENVRMATLPEPLAIFTFTGKNQTNLPTAGEEAARRNSSSGLGTTLRRNAAVVGHRIRKASAGAYLRRRVDISIYTKNSPTQRKRFVCKNLGFGWPR